MDEFALKLHVAQMEALQCLLQAMRAPGGYSDEALLYLLQGRLAGRADDDLTAIGVAQLLKCLLPDTDPQSTPPQLRLIQGGLS